MGQIRISDAVLDEMCSLYGKPVRRGFSPVIQELCLEVRKLRMELAQK